MHKIVPSYVSSSRTSCVNPCALSHISFFCLHCSYQLYHYHTGSTIYTRVIHNLSKSFTLPFHSSMSLLIIIIIIIMHAITTNEIKHIKGIDIRNCSKFSLIRAKAFSFLFLFCFVCCSISFVSLFCHYEHILFAFQVLRVQISMHFHVLLVFTARLFQHILHMSTKTNSSHIFFCSHFTLFHFLHTFLASATLPSTFHFPCMLVLIHVCTSCVNVNRTKHKTPHYDIVRIQRCWYIILLNICSPSICSSHLSMSLFVVLVILQFHRHPNTHR